MTVLRSGVARLAERGAVQSTDDPNRDQPGMRAHQVCYNPRRHPQPRLNQLRRNMHNGGDDMARRDSFRRPLTGWLTSPGVVALLLGVLGVLIVLGGVLYHHCACQSWPNLVAGWEQEFEALYANFATTLIGIAIAVFTIDRANERRAEQQLKAQLIREMGSTDNGIALRATNELRVRGEIQDGSLVEINLSRANLQYADLSQSNLPKANLSRANLRSVNLSKAILQGTYLHRAKLEGVLAYETNLRGAFLRRGDLKDAYIDEAELQGAYFEEANLQGMIMFGCNLLGAKGLDDRQLFLAASLRGTTMPNGRLYEGRYNLKADFVGATGRNINFANYLDVINSKAVNPPTPEAMAIYYGVPLETYLHGQEWARENLPRLRREAGLEQDEAAEAAGPSQSEEPQSASPLSSPLPPPVVPAKSLLSFTVRRLIGLFWPFGL
jgi:uncharacterized protein YjbI with pentapeptide repeats